MLTLGIETSGRSGSIALLDHDTLIGECELSATGRRHARTLVPEIGVLLKEAKLTPGDLQTIAVSIGPGSFTGLRVGVVCAKTLAYALNCPIVAVDTFEAIALQTNRRGMEVCVIDDALRGDVFAGIYVTSAEMAIACKQAPKIISAEQLISQLPGETLLSGPGIKKLTPIFDDHQQASLSEQEPQAKTIARLGFQKAQLGQFDSHWTIAPHYLRRSAAEEKADAEVSSNSQKS